MQRDNEYLVDILEAAKLIIAYVRDKEISDFLVDFQCQDAVIRRFEIIGEAARRLSEDKKKSLPEIPWIDIISMRNIMIREYDDVDFSIVWETIQQDIPILIEILEKNI